MNNALVLSGGGARAAYQIGVLQGLQEILNNEKPFNIYVGSSGGAINATHLASYYGRFSFGLQELNHLWSNLNSSQVYHTGFQSVLRVGGKLARDFLFRKRSFRQFRYFMDTAPLRELISKHQAHERLHRQIDKGDLKGLCIAATSYSEASTIYFMETARKIAHWRRHRRRSEFCRITVDHVMASCAIPLIFPPIRIGEHFYADGSTRNIFPVSPAVRMGCDRILAVGVRINKDEHLPLHYEPSLARQTSVLLNALFFDAMDSDLEQLEIKNQIARNHRTEKPLKDIRYLMISPSQDLSEIALKHRNEAPRSLMFFLDSLGTAEEAASLLSYLLFEPGFTRSVIDLGYRDAYSRKQEIKQLFSESGSTVKAPATAG